MTPTQIGILRDIGENKISLDESLSEWMREQLTELIFHNPMLIDTIGPSVVLTEAGRKFLSERLGP